MDAELTWRRLPTASADGEPRRFDVECGRRSVPGVVWLPTRVAAAPPAVMLGHGGSNDKLSARNRRLAGLLNAVGLAAVAIDGPFHGDRPGAPTAPRGYQQLVVDEGVSAVADRMTADWQASLVALQRERVVGEGPAGYIGLSMGARYGLPLAAALGSRLGAVVMGAFGLVQTPLMDARLHPVDDIERSARVVVAPTLVHVQWDDEIFPREGQLALFGLVGARDKHLLAYPGDHAAAPPEAEREWTRFVADRLSDDPAATPR